MQRPLEVPCITDQATKLLGGRLCRLYEQKSAIFDYKRNNADLLLFAFHGKNLPFSSKYKVRLQGRDMYVENIGGRPVALWHRGGIVYSMVGDLNRDDLLTVASTLYYR
jgi:anti-sigma factor RsiW